MRTLILSDIHLGSKHCSPGPLRELLERDRFDRLILNGDTLNSVNLKKLHPQHWGILDLLRSIRRQRELIVIRGNHDHEALDAPSVNGQHFCTRGVLPALLDLPHMEEEYPLDIAGRPYRILHGDRFDPTLTYPVVTDAAVFCYHLTTKLNKKLAKWLKRKSKKWGGVLELVRDRSIAYAQKQNATGIITGHTHFAEDSQVGDVHYVNTGCWTEPPFTYVTVEHGKLGLHHASE